MSQWYLEGKPVEHLPVDDRAVQYGDGLFETIAVRNGEPRLLSLHLDRLARGCARLRIEMPAVPRLHEDLAFAIQNSNAISAYCVAKIIVSSGVGQRGYGRPPATAAVVLIGVFPARPIAASAYANGVDTIPCKTRLASGSPTAGLKTLNRIEQVLGRSECLDGGAFEGLMLDAEDRLICGTMSNVFIVVDQQVITPSLERCGVEGIMRRFTIELLRDEGVDVAVRDVAMAECNGADEVFLTNSQFGALPVSRIGGRKHKPGDVTNMTLSALARNGIAECAV